jgi:hypothetical protein
VLYLDNDRVTRCHVDDSHADETIELCGSEIDEITGERDAGATAGPW